MTAHIDIDVKGVDDVAQIGDLQDNPAVSPGRSISGSEIIVTSNFAISLAHVVDSSTLKRRIILGASGHLRGIGLPAGCLDRNQYLYRERGRFP